MQPLCESLKLSLKFNQVAVKNYRTLQTGAKTGGEDVMVSHTSRMDLFGSDVNSSGAKKAPDFTVNQRK